MCLNFICHNLNLRNVFFYFVTKYAYFLHENNPGVKINGAYFRNALMAHLLPVIRNMAPEGCFIFSRTVYQPTEPDNPPKC